MGFWRWLLLLSVSVWIGAILFFSGAVAPLTFQHFPKETAGQIVGLYFPRYYLVGSVCGVIALLAILLLQAMAKRWEAGTILATLLIAAMLGANLYAGIVVYPNAHELRTHTAATVDASAAASAPSAATSTPEPSAEFLQLHRLALQLNVAVLGIGLLLLAFLSSRLQL